MHCTLNKRLADWTEKQLPGLSSIKKKQLHTPTHLRILPHPGSHTGHASAQFARNHKATTTVKVINPFPALIKSKYLLNFDYFCSIFISRRWSAVSLNHSIPPESMMNQLRDGGGFVA